MTMTRNAITILVSAALGIVIGVTVGTQIGVSRNESPYLKHPQRLGDVVAAISVMGTYKWDSVPADRWQELIGGAPHESEVSWSDVFTDHPEFFRMTGKDNTTGKGKWSLVWRRARDWSWDTKTGKPTTEEEELLAQLCPEDNCPEDRFSRKPLAPDETTKLIGIALNMQTQAIARRVELRCWVPVVVGVICVFIGAHLKS
jgi:hypothetical protein